jgi:hypothetical protein
MGFAAKNQFGKRIYDFHLANSVVRARPVPDTHIDTSCCYFSGLQANFDSNYYVFQPNYGAELIVF